MIGINNIRTSLVVPLMPLGRFRTMRLRPRSYRMEVVVMPMASGRPGGLL